MNHLPKLFSEKPWGVYIGFPREEKLILSSNRAQVDIVILPSSHQNAVITMECMNRDKPEMQWVCRFGFPSPDRMAQLRLPKVGKETNPRPGKQSQEWEWQDSACCSWGWEGAMMTALKHVIYVIYIYFRHFVCNSRNRKVTSIPKLTGNKQWVLQ